MRPGGTAAYTATLSCLETKGFTNPDQQVLFPWQELTADSFGSTRQESLTDAIRAQATDNPDSVQALIDWKVLAALEQEGPAPFLTGQP